MSTETSKKSVSHQSSLRSQDPHLEREQENYSNPLPSREFILQILAQHGIPSTAEELGQQLDITEEEFPLFDRRLRAMERDGQILINRKGAVCVPEKLDLIKGRVQGHADGFGFLVPDEGGDDLFLGPREMDKALHGDRVMARISGVDRRGRKEAKIVEVIERVNTRLVGRLYSEHNVMFVVAEDKRVSQDILLPPGETGGATIGQIVMVEIVVQPNKHTQPIGRVVEVLGNYGDAGMEIEIALRKHDLPFQFSEEVEKQAKKTPASVRKLDWKPEEGLEREDIRHLPLVTIDGETARDFDDAVFCEPDGRGFRLLVAIADVSYYVRPGDALDRSAIDRGNSVYFPRRVIPMLPEQLSNGICSLNPAVDRMCMVCDMNVSATGQVKKYRFYPAVMHSHARLTYTKVADMLAEPAGETAREYQAVLPQVNDLYRLFKVLLKARVKRGAIDFETVETQMIFDDNGKIVRIVPVHRNEAHRLIEECMLAANVCASDYLEKNEHPTLYRVHQGPTPERLENLHKFLKEFGLVLGGGDEPHAKDYAELLEKIKTRPDAALMQTALLRSLRQAVYSPDNVGHFGLAYDGYAHFTSPIRRYPDLLVHRAIKAVLRGQQYTPAMKWAELGEHCSMTERRADDATRDVESWLKCFYMRDKLGEVFTGTISAVTGFGVFVLLDDIYTEGLVHISELGSDYYHYDQALHSLIGERTGNRFRLGDRLQVKVVRVDMETSKIDFVLVQDDATKAAEKAAVNAKPAKKAAAKPAAKGGAAAKGKAKAKVAVTGSADAVGEAPAPKVPKPAAKRKPAKAKEG